MIEITISFVCKVGTSAEAYHRTLLANEHQGKTQDVVVGYSNCRLDGKFYQWQPGQDQERQLEMTMAKTTALDLQIDAEQSLQ